MAQNVYKQAEKEDSKLYKNFNLDLGETIELVKEIKMFDVEKYTHLGYTVFNRPNYAVMPYINQEIQP